MSAAQSSLLENIGDTDLDPGSGSSLEGSTENLLVKPSVARRRANLQEVENVYITVSPTPLTLTGQRFESVRFRRESPNIKRHLIRPAESERVPRRQLPGLQAASQARSAESGSGKRYHFCILRRATADTQTLANSVQYLTTLFPADRGEK